MDAKNRLGIVLILIGAVLLANYFNILPGESVLLMMSAVFAVGYFYMGKDHYYSLGMIIPSAMCFSIYAYTAVEELPFIQYFEGSLFFVFIALGFFAVWLFHTRRFGKGGSSYWPLIVTASTGGFAVFVFTMEVLTSESARDQAGVVAPAILIIVGLILVLASMMRKK